jgi:hypothetical protein
MHRTDKVKARDSLRLSVGIHSPEIKDEFQALDQKAFSVLKGDGKHKKESGSGNFHQSLEFPFTWWRRM